MGFFKKAVIKIGKHKMQDLPPWATTEKPISERGTSKQKPFLQISATVLQDERFNALNLSEQKLYCCMVLEAGGKQSFTFPRLAALKYGISEASLPRGIKALVEAGFIECVQNNKNLRIANTYKFTPEKWKSRPLPETPRVTKRKKPFTDEKAAELQKGKSAKGSITVIECTETQLHHADRVQGF